MVGEGSTVFEDESKEGEAGEEGRSVSRSYSLPDQLTNFNANTGKLTNIIFGTRKCLI